MYVYRHEQYRNRFRTPMRTVRTVRTSIFHAGLRPTPCPHRRVQPCGIFQLAPSWSKQANVGGCAVNTIRQKKRGLIAKLSVSRRQARNQARAARKLASRTSTVTMWWRGLTVPRPDFFTPMSLALSLGQPMRRMAAALRWLGWRRVVRRVHGVQVLLWLPPTSTIKPRPVGRPRVYER